MFSRFSIKRTTSALLLLAAAAAQAQAPTPGQKKAPTAFVQFWNMCASGDQAINLVLAKGENEHPLFSGISPFDFTGYQPVEPKKCRLQATDASGTVLDEVEINAGPNEYFTVTAKSEKKGVKLAVTDDTYSYVQGAPGKATIYQFIPGAVAEIEAPGGGTKTLQFGETVTFENLPVSVSIPVKVKNAGGKVANNAFAMNFNIGNRMAGLIIQDRYGRSRVRMAYTGYIFDPDVVDPGAPAVPATPPPNP